MPENTIKNVNVEADVVSDEESSSSNSAPNQAKNQQVGQLKKELEALTDRVDQLSCCQDTTGTTFSELLHANWPMHPIKRI